MTSTDAERVFNMRIDVLGVEVSAIDLEFAVKQIRSWVSARSPNYVCVRDVHGVMASLRDPELIDIHNRAGMVTPDGMPLVWCGRLAGASWTKRVYGPDLMLSVCEESTADSTRHFLYGAGPGVANDLAEKLRYRFPDIQIVGAHSPPYGDLTEEEVSETAAMINAARPDIVWVGLSTPKQERWMANFRRHLEAPVLIGVGAAFDMHAGRVRQAPEWIQKSGFEWLFRLCVEPRRLWRRYLTAIPTFLVQIAMRPPRLKGGAPSSHR
ncbi:MAG: WecB/TagA/CpsF family glycosyltransferase [Actinomycetota bacterium]